MAEIKQTNVSYIRAFRPVDPSESLMSFLGHAEALLRDEFEDATLRRRARIFSLDSLRVTLFERRAQLLPSGQTDSEALSKLHVVMAQPKITVTERRRTRPGVFETITKREVNPLIGALALAESIYLQDGEEDENDRTRPLVRASTVIDSTEDVYRQAGTQLALRIDESDVLAALDAQRSIFEDRAKVLNANRRLARPEQQDGPLAIPFMVAPFDSADQRDEFIDRLASELPVYGSSVGPIQWQLKT